jgi:hypothetical protein
VIAAFSKFTMKQMLMIFGTIMLLFSVYYFLEASDIFIDMYSRGFHKTNKGDLLQPILLLIMGLLTVYFSINRQKFKKDEL